MADGVWIAGALFETRMRQIIEAATDAANMLREGALHPATVERHCERLLFLARMAGYALDELEGPIDRSKQRALICGLSQANCGFDPIKAGS